MESHHSIAEAASLTGLSQSGIRARIRRGALSAHHERGRWWIPADEIEEAALEVRQRREDDERLRQRRIDEAVAAARPLSASELATVRRLMAAASKPLIDAAA